jgi:two-component system, response regulator PdtaR
MKNDRSHIVATVLIVEDEALIRLCMVAAFSEAGFRVLEATDAEWAIDILRGDASDIDVLFTDVNMPGPRNGIELAHHVRQHWPSIALLVTSGKMAPAAAELPSGSRFLQKPYDSLIAIKHVIELACAA